MYLEVPESWEEGRAEMEEERQKYMEILDYQGGGEKTSLWGADGRARQDGSQGRSREEDRHSRRAEGKK